MSVNDIKWVAEMFQFNSAIFSIQGKYPAIRVASSSVGDIERLYRVLKPEGTIDSYTRLNGTRHGKEIYTVTLNGLQAAGWLMTVYSFLNGKYRMQARSILNYWIRK